MLEGLDDINWSLLRHAYGPAIDVPDLLRKRASADPEIASGAEFELFGNILHQGTVYPATSHAVPFIVELLESQTISKRSGLIVLLACIAKGTGYYQVHGSLPLSQKAIGAEKIAYEITEENIFVSRAHTSVEAHLKTFIRLLDDTDKEVRYQIPCLLSVLPCAQDWIRQEALKRACGEQDSIVATNLILALANAVMGPDRMVTTCSKFQTR